MCPRCKNPDLISTRDALVCNGCKKSYTVENGVPVFNKLEQSNITDGLDKIKFALKKYARIYDFLTKVISPVYYDIRLNEFLKSHVYGKNALAINFGSGNSNLSPHVSNADIFAYDNVDLVCDISNIPFQDDSVDVIVSIAVLEHVPDPAKVVAEFYRVLKPGGKIFCYFPFIAGFHASPYDYLRRTYEGMKVLFKDYQIDSLQVAGGPTSGMLWIVQEWLAMVFSFGSARLHQLFHLFFMLVTFPVKYLDVLFIRYPAAKNISSGFSIIATKTKHE
jgi:SAM-dependent methyltransferase